TRIRRFKERLKKATKTEINEGIDIANFSQNDEGFYSSRYVPTVKNFARKQKKGILNKDLARLGMSNHVSDLIKRYNKYNGMEGHYFSPETKAVIADELVDMDWDEIKDGTWN
ncbi:MAG: hypothetical protein KAQ85_09135, partial [Thermodesulfovibrionia bacterium]|nr:hypothetical protein [Thermodesulfovibrionia bacterium]